MQKLRVLQYVINPQKYLLTFENHLPKKWQWLGLLGNRLVKSSNRLVNEKRQLIGKKVKSLGWLFWPNESKSSHVIIGNLVFIIYA